MDEGKNISFDFNKVNEERANRRGIIEARNQRSKDARDVSSDVVNLQKDVQSYLNALNQFKKDYGELSKTQQKDFNALTSYAEKLKSVVEDTNNSYTETVELVSDVAKFLDKNLDRTYELKIAQAQSEEEYIDLIRERNELEGIYGDIVDDNVKRLETHKRAQDSLFDSFKDKLGELKTDFKDLATITGLDNIYNTLSGKNGQLSAYNTMRSQFSMSKSDFNTFKRDIFTNIKENGNILKYGFQDALDYMQRLGELGITDLDMAKEQMDAIMLSTKYLGMSADTQTKILKQARNTGNMDLLNQTNQTMVKIMNAQLGVSQDQLDAIINQSAGLAELSTMFGGSPEALQNFTMSASAIESVYGPSASKAAMDIATDLLNNGGNSKYVAVLGENYGNIMNALQAGNGDALYQILTAVKSSQVTQAGSYNAQSWASLSGSGYLDQNTLALTNSRAKEGSSYGTALSDIAASSDDTKKYLDDIQVDFKSMVENATSWINAWVPLGSLQTIYYTLAIADMAFGVGKSLWNISKFLLKDGKEYLTELLHNSNSGMDILKGSNGLLSTAGSILSSMSILAGASIAIYHGIGTINKAQEWQVSSLSAFLGGVLGGGDEEDRGARIGKSAGTGALVGAGIGWKVGGIKGALIGGLIGLIGGGISGAIGSERIAKALGDSGAAPITSLGYGRGDATDGVMPGNVSKKNFPWRLTSPFGYRGVLNTSKGKTNPFHSGIDLASSWGTPIGANNAGTVSAVGTANDGANYVIINSGNGYEQLYWHLSKPSTLTKGQHVNAGQLIGYMGATGKATGTHLHFGLRKAGTSSYVDPINSVNTTLFNASENGVTTTMDDLQELIEANRPGTTTVLQKMVDADTMSKEVQALAFDGVGSSDVVDSVNGGFTNLINKLEELSSRQNEQEELLKMLAQGKGTNVYRY